MDYGHDLTFGSFITLANAAPQEVVSLALLSERSGLDRLAEPCRGLIKF